MLENIINMVKETEIFPAISRLPKTMVDIDDIKAFRLSTSYYFVLGVKHSVVVYSNLGYSYIENKEILQLISMLNDLDQVFKDKVIKQLCEPVALEGLRDTLDEFGYITQVNGTEDTYTEKEQMSICVLLDLTNKLKSKLDNLSLGEMLEISRKFREPMVSIEYEGRIYPLVEIKFSKLPYMIITQYGLDKEIVEREKKNFIVSLEIINNLLEHLGEVINIEKKDLLWSAYRCPICGFNKRERVYKEIMDLLKGGN